MHPDFRWIGKSDDGETVTLRKFGGAYNIPNYVTPEWLAENAEKIRTGVVIDVETTGLNKKSDSVIEIGLRKFRFNRANGDLVESVQSYSGLQDPGKPLSDDIKRLTGLTDADLQGKKIDWKAVEAALSEAQVVIAHNAAFDRPFIERYCPAASHKVWACSFKQVDWARKGFNVQKLEILSIYHGFFADSHRAQSDVDALLHLLVMTDWTTHKTYLNELLINARRPQSRVVAAKSPFESKDALKERHYNWDATAKCWSKMIYHDTLADEIAWLEAVVYNGVFGGRVEEIALTDNFKS